MAQIKNLTSENLKQFGSGLIKKAAYGRNCIYRFDKMILPTAMEDVIYCIKTLCGVEIPYKIVSGTLAQAKPTASDGVAYVPGSGFRTVNGIIYDIAPWNDGEYNGNIYQCNGMLYGFVNDFPHPVGVVPVLPNGNGDEFYNYFDPGTFIHNCSESPIPDAKINIWVSEAYARSLLSAKVLRFCILDPSYTSPVAIDIPVMCKFDLSVDETMNADDSKFSLFSFSAHLFWVVKDFRLDLYRKASNGSWSMSFSFSDPTGGYSLAQADAV